MAWKIYNDIKQNINKKNIFKENKIILSVNNLEKSCIFLSIEDLKP